MRIRPGVILVLAAILGLLFGGRYLGWYGTDRANQPTPGTPGTEGPEPTSVTVSTPPPTPDTAPKPAPRPSPTPQPRPATVVATPPPVVPTNAVPTLITNWEQRIDALLTEPGDEAVKSRELLALLPNLPEDGQVEAAQHLSNLLSDEDFNLLGPTLTNAAVAEAVLDVLMTDVLNRPNNLKLPALLEVARIPGHPKASEARDILEIFVDDNFEEDWAAWQAAVNKWMVENPE